MSRVERVVFIGAEGPALELVRGAFADDADVEIVEMADLAAVPAFVRRSGGGLVVAGPAVALDEAIDLAGALADDRASVVVVASALSTGIVRRAMRSGVSDVLGEDDDPDEAASSLRAALAGLPEPEPVAEDGERYGTVVTIFGTKGGVGKSTVATNLAAALAGAGVRTIIADLDLQFGDVGIMVGLAPDRTIYDAVQDFDSLDEEMLAGFLTPHPSGFRALLAPVRPEEAEAVTPERIARILELLRHMADVVIVDTAGAFDEVVLAALDGSDVVYAVATLDVPSVKNTRVSLQKLAQHGYNGTTVRVVLNRADSKVWLQIPDVEKTIERAVVARIPSDRVVPRSVNRGVPVVLDEPHSAVAKSLVALAASVRRAEAN